MIVLVGINGEFTCSYAQDLSAAPGVKPLNEVCKECYSAGEETDPKKYEEGIRCCEGLSEIIPGRLLQPCDQEGPKGAICEDGCTIIPPTLPGLVQCAPCGNGICEPEYGENKCNCPEDCD